MFIIFEGWIFSYMGEYEELVDCLGAGGAVNLRRINNLYLKSDLTSEQDEQVKQLVSKYIIDSLFRGQLRDLIGLDELVDNIDLSGLVLNTDLLQKISYYDKQLSAGDVEQLVCYDSVKGLGHKLGEEVTPGLIKELKSLGQVLLLMKGRHSQQYTTSPSVIKGLIKLFKNSDQLSFNPL